MRRDRVQGRKGDVGVAVVVARLDQDGEFECTAALGAGLGGGGATGAGEENGNYGGNNPPALDPG